MPTKIISLGYELYIRLGGGGGGVIEMQKHITVQKIRVDGGTFTN